MTELTDEQIQHELDELALERQSIMQQLMDGVYAC